MDFTKTEKTPIYLPQTHTTVTAIHTCSYANSVDFCANPNALKELAFSYQYALIKTSK